MKTGYNIQSCTSIVCACNKMSNKMLHAALKMVKKVYFRWINISNTFNMALTIWIIVSICNLKKYIYILVIYWLSRKMSMLHT